MAHTGKRRESQGVPRMKSGEPDTIVNGKSVTTLKLWMIRLIRSGVILEGYKNVSAQDLTTLQNWRSSEITTRIDARTVSTRQGSIYRLKGGMDEEEAAEAGLPEELIEAFASGFPENWDELIQSHVQGKDGVRRRQSMNTRIDEETKTGTARGNNMAQVDMSVAPDSCEDTLNGSKKRLSMQKGRKSLMHHVQPDTTIEEEEEEEEVEEKTPVRRKTPARSTKTSETRMEDKKTPRREGRGRATTWKKDAEEDKEQKKPTRGGSANRTYNGGKKTPERVEIQEEEEVFATPDETPREKNTTRTVAVVSAQKRKKEPSSSQRRVSLDDIPREIMDKSIPLSRWVIAFVRGGAPKSIFPHFQFLIRGLRPENLDAEWKSSVIQKVVPPYIMFTSSSIYRLDGPLDVDQATEMGFPSPFITDFLMGFPDDWEERLETFFNKTFGPPPQPRIVEVMSDGETCKDDEKLSSVKNEKISKGKDDEYRRTSADKTDREQEEKEKRKTNKEEVRESKRNEEGEESKKKKMGFETPRNKDGQKIRAKGLSFPMGESFASTGRKRKEPTPSSPSHSEEDSEMDEEELLIREAEKVEKRMRKEEEKKKARMDMTVGGVRTSRSGRLIRTPRATWAGEGIVYDVHGNAVEMKAVTTTTKMTVGKTNDRHNELMAAHYGFDSPLTSVTQKERSIAPPTACLPKTPAPKKSKAEARGYSDDETDKKIYFDQYMSMLEAQAEATPAFNLKRGNRRLRVVESSDSEAEAEERKKEQKRKMREERRRLKESEEEESSDDGYRRRKKTKAKKKISVKKEKQVKEASMKRRQRKKEEMESDLEIDHDEDAVTFNPSEEGSNEERGNGYSDDDLIQFEEEKEMEEKMKKKKEPVKRAKEWKKEEVLRLKLAIQAADPSSSVEGWDIVAKSVGGGRTAEDCKKAARERLKMKVDEPKEVSEEGGDGSDAGWSGAESGAASEDEEKRIRKKGKLDGITAKKGTVKYAVEMDNKKREMIMGSSSQDDFFKNAKSRISGVEPLPSVGVFDPNDSLLSVFDDDDDRHQPKARTTKTALMAAAPATPRLSELSSMSPGTSTGGSARRSLTKFIPSPVVNPEDTTRYVHHLNRTRNMSLMSKSMADQSRLMPPRVPPARNLARTAEAIDKVEKELKNQRKARENMDDLDEDDENDDNLLPAGF